jgi:IS1 family transposase
MFIIDVWGKRDLKTAGKMKKKLSDFGVTGGSIATDGWDSFTATFWGENHLVVEEIHGWCRRK